MGANLIMIKIIKDILRPVKRLFLCFKGVDFFCRRDIRLPLEFHGSDYGGWHIVAGRVRADSVVLSFGLGHDISFDSSIIENYKCKICGYDPDPKAWAHFEGKTLPEGFTWIRKGVSDSTGVFTFYPPTREDYVSGTILKDREGFKANGVQVELVDVVEIINQLAPEGKVEILKMDIEGAEYAVVKRLVDSGAVSRINQLLVEFHHGDGVINISDSIDAIRRLRAAGFKVAHVSKVGREYLFVRDGL
jgi:FkbM family methyltransferase